MKHLFNTTYYNYMQYLTILATNSTHDDILVLAFKLVFYME